MLTFLKKTDQLSTAPIVSKNETVAEKTLRMREYRQKMGFLLKATLKVPYYCWNPSGHGFAQHYWQFASMDTERGHTSDNRTKCLRVVVHHQTYGPENMCCTYVFLHK